MDAINAQLDALYRAHEPYIRRLCAYRLQSCPDAIDDCVQETFTALLKALRDGVQIASPRAYLTRTALNLITDRYRTGAVEREKLVPFDPEYHGGSAPDDYFRPEELTDEQLQQAMFRVMGQLSDAERQLVEAYYTRRESVRYIAKHTGLTETNVKQRLFRVRKVIRKLAAEAISQERGDAQ